MRGLLFLTLAIFLAGCTSRTIVVTSEPPGALVTLNGVEVGATPLEVGFRYYGQYDLRLRKDGYQPLAAAPWANAPWYEYPPIDFIILPLPIETRIRWHYDLEAVSVEQDAAEALIERGEEMRQAVEPG
ncbi:MAG: PEGA domain-containing protein [Phycisphaera sp.]|nr:MAG: PEGA domain-containing protein [Phycisphaera sp.]